MDRVTGLRRSSPLCPTPLDESVCMLRLPPAASLVLAFFSRAKSSHAIDSPPTSVQQFSRTFSYCMLCTRLSLLAAPGKFAGRNVDGEEAGWWSARQVTIPTKKHQRAVDIASSRRTARRHRARQEGPASAVPNSAGESVRSLATLFCSSRTTAACRTSSFTTGLKPFIVPMLHATRHHW